MPLMSDEVLTCRIPEIATLYQALAWVAFNIVPVPYNFRQVIGFDKIFQRLSEESAVGKFSGIEKIDRAERQLFQCFQDKKIKVKYLVPIGHFGDGGLSDETRELPADYEFHFENIDFRRSRIESCILHIDTNEYAYGFHISTNDLFTEFPPPDKLAPKGVVAPLVLLRKHEETEADNQLFPSDKFGEKALQVKKTKVCEEWHEHKTGTLKKTTKPFPEESPDLAEWIFQRHLARNGSSENWADIYAAASLKNSGLAVTLEKFNSAYQKIFATKRGRRPAQGWSLQGEYQSRYEQEIRKVTTG